MILPIQCFGRDSSLIPILPEESHARSKKFIFPRSNYSILIKKQNYLLYAKYPETFQINANNNSLKLTRQFVITDEYEGNEFQTEISFPLNSNSKIALKFPYGFRFNYLSYDTSIQISENNLCFSNFDQSRENYKYYLYFSLGEKINFINQVQYSKKTLYSVFYSIDQFSLIHSIHPFTPNLLISSCLRLKNVGLFDFSQKINYKSDKYLFVFGLYNIINDLKKINLRKASSGINLIKNFEHLTTGFQLECNHQNYSKIFPAIYVKYRYKKMSSIILTDFEKAKLGLKMNFSEKSSLHLSFTKFPNNDKVCFNIKYVSSD